MKKRTPASRGRRPAAGGNGIGRAFMELSVLGKVASSVVAIGGAISVLYFGGTWVGSKVVWASEFQQTVADFNCQFADIKRTQLEGQLADADYRVNTAGSKKILTSEEAQDLAKLKVQRDQIQRRLNSLPDCEQAQPQQRFRPTGQQRQGPPS